MEGSAEGRRNGGEESPPIMYTGVINLGASLIRRDGGRENFARVNLLCSFLSENDYSCQSNICTD